MNACGTDTLALVAAVALLMAMSRPTAAAGADSSQEAQPLTHRYARLRDDAFLKRWLLLGPLRITPEGAPRPDSADQEKAFREDLLAPVGGEANAQPRADDKVALAGQEHAWKLVSSPTDSVDLAKELGAADFAAAYAFAEVESPRERRVLLGVGSDDAVKVWLNGELVHDNWTLRALRPDEDLVPITLRRGPNRLLLKVQNGEMGWGFSCRVLGRATLAERLVTAAGRDDLDVVEMLLRSGVSPGSRSRDGLTALQAAQISGYAEAARLLAEKGAAPRAKLPSLESYVDSILHPATRELAPGAAILVAREGEVLLRKGYGYASLEHRVPVTPKTKFRIGSVTKQFTAAAILRLQEQGKLSVEDKLSKFLPDFPRADEVTLHHLLTHTSGIHSYTNKPDFLQKVTSTIQPDDLIKSFRDDPYDFDPGERWSYNNSGYFLLGRIIEMVSGLSYGGFLKREFFEPLGMRDTGVHTYSDILQDEAFGYSYENGAYKKALNWDMSWAGGAGALYSTVDDLHRWNEAIFGGKLLSEETLKAAFTPAKVRNDDGSMALLGEGYGYGWILARMRGARTIEHGGGLHGFSSHLVRYPDQQLTVVVLANALPTHPALTPAEVARGIAQFILWRDLPPRETFRVDTAVRPDTYDDYVGRYDLPGTSLTVSREGDKLFADLPGQGRREILPKAEGEFFAKGIEAWIAFDRDNQGQVVRALLHQGDRRVPAKRAKEETEVKLNPEALDAVAGRYDYGTGIGIMTISREGDRLYAQLEGQPRFEIFPKSATEFFWRVVDAQVVFVKDDQGRVVKAIHHQSGQKIESPRLD